MRNIQICGTFKMPEGDTSPGYVSCECGHTYELPVGMPRYAVEQCPVCAPDEFDYSFRGTFILCKDDKFYVEEGLFKYAYLSDGYPLLVQAIVNKITEFKTLAEARGYNKAGEQ